VVVGLGNDIAGDDGAGLFAVRRLSKQLGDWGGTEFVELPWAGFNLLDVLPGYDRAILIDSLQSGRYPPGTVVELDEQDLAGSVRLISFHDINYPTVLSLGKKLGYEMPDRVHLLGIEGERFDTFTAELTPAVAGGVGRAVKLVKKLLDRWHKRAADGA